MSEGKGLRAKVLPSRVLALLRRLRLKQPKHADPVGIGDVGGVGAALDRHRVERPWGLAVLPGFEPFDGLAAAAVARAADHDQAQILARRARRGAEEALPV